MRLADDPTQTQFAEVVATDVAEATQHYADLVPDLEARFTAALNVPLDTIGDRPELFASFLKDVRKARLKLFPYGVYYRVRPSDVEVIGVLHDKRDPAVLQSRA